jgi:hypothetical protein
MKAKKPYVLFHGYKKFDKKVMPSVKQPLWTGNFVTAESYIGGNSTGGILVLRPDQSKLNIVDIKNEAVMTKAFGSIGKLISKCESFYYFFSDEFPYYASDDETEKMSIETLMSKVKFIKADSKPFVDAVIRFSHRYDMWDDKNIDILTAKLILPKLHSLGFNCIAEHEEGEDNYMLISNEMLAGNCAGFIDKSKFVDDTFAYHEIMKKLASLDIHDPKSAKMIGEIMKNATR